MKRNWIVLITGWVVIFALGLVGFYERMTFGHRLTGYGSYASWGLWVADYIYFIGLSAGAFLLSSMVYVFGVKRLEKIGKLALFTAITALVAAVLVIWFDIGHMLRFYEIFTRPNFRSMMTWMIWLYTAYFLLLVAEFTLVMRPDLSRKQLSANALATNQKMVRILASVGVPLAVLFHGGVGALFAVIGARPYWNTSLLPLMFLLGALLSGGALLATVISFIWPAKDAAYRDLVQYLGRLVLALLLLFVLFEWSEITIPLWSGVSGAFQVEIESVRLALFGPFWWVFWIVHLILGTIIPIVLLVMFPNSPGRVGLASLLVAVAFLGTRLNIVIPGAVTAQLRGLETAYVDPRLVFSYVPTLHEWLVTLFAISIGSGIFILGLAKLPIIKSRNVT